MQTFLSINRGLSWTGSASSEVKLSDRIKKLMFSSSLLTHATNHLRANGLPSYRPFENCWTKPPKTLKRMFKRDKKDLKTRFFKFKSSYNKRWRSRMRLQLRWSRRSFRLKRMLKMLGIKCNIRLECKWPMDKDKVHQASNSNRDKVNSSSNNRDQANSSDSNRFRAELKAWTWMFKEMFKTM